MVMDLDLQADAGTKRKFTVGFTNVKWTHLLNLPHFISWKIFKLAVIKTH